MKERMTKEHLPLYSDEWFANLYLEYGSVESALKAHNYTLPISVADFHRKIKKFGIIKNSGRRRVSMAQVLYFFAEKAIDPKVPLEHLYQNMPASFKDSTSLSTLRRIYTHTVEKITRLKATGLIITREENEDEILLVDERKGGNTFGKATGDSTIPFGVGGANDNANDSILRVLQQEFSIDLTLSGKLKKNSPIVKSLIPENPTPVLQIHLLDVVANIYKINLSKELSDPELMRSHKVANHRFIPLTQIIQDQHTSYRFGIKEILTHFKSAESLHPIPITSSINAALINSQS